MSLEHAEAQMLMARPWDAAESESIWSIDGLYPKGGGAFTDCLAVALPHYATGGHVLFKMIGALEELISPAWITRAKLLILVNADAPGTAYYQADQDYLRAAQEGKP
jgi:hypothetical protein